MAQTITGKGGTLRVQDGLNEPLQVDGGRKEAIDVRKRLAKFEAARVLGQDLGVAHNCVGGSQEFLSEVRKPGALATLCIRFVARGHAWPSRSPAARRIRSILPSRRGSSTGFVS